MHPRTLQRITGLAVLAWLSVSPASPSDAGTRVWTPEFKLTAGDGTAGDQLGTSVAVSGDVAVVGAPFAGPTSAHQGAAYVFTRTGDIWTEQAKLTADDGTEGDHRFGWSVAIDGDTILVGAPGATNANNTSAVYVYTRSGEAWTQQAKLTAADGSWEDDFGSAVALDSDTALVGAKQAFVDGTPFRGAVYAFTRSGDTWTEQAKLIPSDEGRQFGWSLALDGLTALIGASFTNVNGTFMQGAAYVFVRAGNSWTEQAKLVAADGEEGDQLGAAVALAGETAAVGAPEKRIAGRFNQGAIYLFHRDGPTWSQQTRLTASDGEIGDRFGIDVALDGDRLLAGAHTGGFREGAAYVLTRNGETWTEQARLTAVDGTTQNDFGLSVALGGDTLLIGAARAQVGGNGGQGAAYAFTDADVGQLTFTPDPLDFGSVVVGTGGAVMSVALTNTGSVNATVTQIDAPGSPFTATGGTCGDPPFPAAPGASCTLEYTFAPADEGTFSAVVGVDSDTPFSPDSFELVGRGTPPRPDIEVEPESLSALLNVGEITSGTLTIGNPGLADLEWQVIVGDAPGVGAGLLHPVRPVTRLDTPSAATAIDRERLIGSGLAGGRFPAPSSFGDDPDEGTVILTHSASPDIVPGTVACGIPGTPYTYPTQFLRTFMLPDFGILGDFAVTEVAFTVETLVIEDPAVDTVDVTVNLYALDGPFTYANLTPLASQTVALEPQQGTLVTLPVAEVAPAGGTLVMEVAAPLLDHTGRFFAGSNPDGETAPSYLAASACGSGEPVTYTSIGRPDVHLVMTVTGWPIDCTLPDWLAATPLAGTVAPGAEQSVSVIFDASGLEAGFFRANLCLAGNDPDPARTVVPVVLAVTEDLQDARLTGGDGAQFDSFGSAVAIDGDTALVGAPRAAVNGNSQQGAVYVFTRDGDTWSEQAKLVATDGGFLGQFGSAVALQGDTALIGAFGTNVDGNMFQGAAYVFRRDGDIWSEQIKLTADDGAAFDNFGDAVSLDSDTALVGAPSADIDGNDNQGAAYAFHRDGDTWSQQAKLVAGDGGGNDQLGGAVALRGDTALIGAGNATVDGAVAHGAAYVFTRAGESWSEAAKLLAADGSEFDRFGSSVALWEDNSDGIALVGGTGATVNGNVSQGAVWAFAGGGDAWSEEAKLTAGDGAGSDNFGTSVALDGATAAVGAEFADVNGNDNQGAAYVFRRQGGAWEGQLKLVAADGAASDTLGTATALDGSTALIGAPGAAVNGNNGQGAAYLFVLAAGGPPSLAFDPTSLDFGDVEIGTTSAPQSATLHNNGDGDAAELFFNDISASGFDVDVAACGTSLPAGGSCEVVVIFTPPIEGPISPTLVASTPGFPPALLQLSGNGTIASPPSIDVDPDSLSSVLMQGTMETQSLTIANLGDETLEWFVPEDLSEFGDNVAALTVWDDGNGPTLYVGGRAANSEFNGIARWDGEEWSPLGAGVSGTSAQVHALAVFDNTLIAAGSFTEAGGVTVNHVARWDGSAWSPLGAGFNSTVHAVTVFDGALIAAGAFTETGGQPINRIARWDGSAWLPLGEGINSAARELTVFDGDLIVGGLFTQAGGAPANRIARWDGSAWSPLGAGVSGAVLSLTEFDGALIAGGNFTEAGGEPANRVASWDGSVWSALGTGIPGGVTTNVEALTVFDGELIAGGFFTEAGGVPANRIASWDGSEWSPLGTGMNQRVSALTLFDGALIAGGQFTEAGGTPADRIARWDGVEWLPMVSESAVCALPEWLDVDPRAGSVPGGDAQPVSITFDATALELGEHETDLCIINTDQNAALVTVPIDLTVTAAPEADISPESFTFALPQGGSDGGVLDIGNVGAADLEWSIGAVASDLVFFDDIDFTVPATQFGGSVRWDTGETCECQSQPFNFNMWRTQSDNNLAFFWPGQEAAGGGGVSLDSSTYAVLGPGATVGPHSDFIRLTATSATAGWRQVAGVDGSLGFRFVHPDTGLVNYGYARITTTGISGHPATVRSWVYDQAGNSVAVGGCTDPADIPWLTVAPLVGTTPPNGSVPVDVVVSVADLASGVYQEQFCVTTNDPQAPLVAIPVELTVVGDEPIVDIDPEALELEVPQGGTGEELLNVGNLGTADLEWSLQEAEALEGGGDAVADGGFEAGTPNPFWEESSTNFGTPLCDADCGVNGAHSGSWWAWFGGIPNAAETGVLTQEVTLPADDSAELRFWLVIPDAFVPGQLEVSLDGEVLFSVTDAEAGDFPVYTEVVLDVAAFADGAAHELAFEGVTEAGPGVTSFFIDDVSLVVGAGGGCASPTDIPWLTATPTSGTTPPDGSVPVTVAADAAELEPGTYQAQLCLTSNDPATPLVEIPVTLNVTGTGAHKWIWQNPLPQGNPLHDVAFVDADNGAAVGAYGAIVRTTDGGTTWVAQDSGTSVQLNGVTFVDAMRGTAVGAGGTILATTDGGGTWVPRTSGTASDLHGVAFPDAEHGIAVGAGGTILATADGGVTWTPRASGTASELRDVAFTDVDTGSAVGASGTILRTTDGGVTWLPQASGTTNTLSAVAFIDTVTGTAVGSGGRILRTIDGGATWTPQPSGVTSTLHEVAFADADRGWVVGFPNLILHTDDGGTTWMPQPSGVINALFGVSALAADVATAVGPVGVILRTEDGGETWENQLPGPTDTLVGVSFTDSLTGTAVGNAGTILRTTDGGGHWVRQDSGTTTALRQVFFADAGIGTAVGEQGLILHTTDGGQSWQPPASGTTQTLRGVYFTGTETGTVVGLGGTILTTDDGGATWTARASGTSQPLYGVSFADADHGMAVGEGGTVLKTIDGGVTWSPQDTGSTSNIYAGVSYVDPQTAVVVGLNMFGTDSRILRTEDGGSTWVLQQAGTSSPLNGVSFFDADRGTAVGGGGTILSTVDGGETWVRDDSRTTNILYSVVFTGADHGTAVGFGGTILRCCGAAAELSVTPDPLDFGEVPVGETGGPASLTLTNTGTQAVTVSELSGPEAPFAPAGGDCGSPPFTLAPTASCTLDFTFGPTVDGPAMSSVTITSDAPSSPDAAALLGVGVTGGVAELTFDPADLDFGDVPVGTTSPPQTATLANTGDVDLTGIAFTPPGGGFDADTNACGTTLAAGESCAIHVVFTPPAPGPATAALTVTSDQQAAADLALAGRGVEEPGTEEQKLIASDGEPDGFFGRAVDVVGDTALIGAAGNVDGTITQGAAYVFTRSAGVWSEQTKLIASDAAAFASFGNAVALDGDTALIGAITATVDGDVNRGAAYVFVRQGDTWIEQARLIASDGADTDNFGSSVALDGDVALIGAHAADVDDDSNQGAAYVFTRSGDTWTEQAKLTASDGALLDNFGSAVALQGDTALVGAAFANVDGNFDQGAVYVFGRDGGDWTEQGKITAGDGAENLAFGISLALSGDRALIGAPGDEVDGVFRGAAYVFARSGDGWLEQSKLTASDDGTDGVEFGAAVALAGDTALVGAPWTPVNGNAVQGAAWLFTHDSTSWNRERKLTASDGGSDDFLGGAVALADGAALAGAWLADVNSNANQGAVYVFDRGDEAPAPELIFDPTGLDFGDVPVGGTSPPQIATLSNTGDADATGLSFGPLGNGFEADTSACGDTLPSGGGCDVSVTFSPAAPGPAGATLAASSAEGAAAELALSGNGVGDEGFTAMTLAVDPEPLASDGNGVFEPGEQVEVAPAWRNDGAAPHALAGTAAAFTGPEGAAYTLVEDAADYGTLDPGQTASCQDTGACYQLGVDDPAARPATHWEASFVETLDDSDGTTKTWTLHIGDSFTDVPRESLFYPWIETLLHHRVTGGCADATYCPAAANTRGQMAVFLLKVSEGGDYLPPACVEGEEVFADVSFDNLFCSWIEELAGRGVTAGCGGGNYCPNASVNRDQMAVFLLKALESPGYTPPACSGVFGDVPCPSLFANWVEDLVDRGITAGCGGGNYCPANPVSRDQMAVFLGKTFGMTLYGP